jgi:hypothetical protein
MIFLCQLSQKKTTTTASDTHGTNLIAYQNKQQQLVVKTQDDPNDITSKTNKCE